MNKILTIALLVLLNAPSAAAQSTLSPVDSTRLKWLRGEVLVLDDTLAAVPDLISQLGAFQVVALGEATHGDGSAFLLRSQITAALHEKGGFDALVIEALGRFDDPTSIRSGAARLWSGSKEARPGLMWALGDDGAATMDIVGLDVQHGDVDAWWDRSELLLEQMGLADTTWAVVRSTLGSAFSNPFQPIPDDRQTLIRQSISELTQRLRENDGALEADFLENALANAATAWEQSYAPRNRQMAANLQAVSTAHKGTVVWAASSHLLRNLEAVDSMSPEWNYDGSITVGSEIKKVLGPEYFVVAFVACGGRYGASHINLTENTVPSPPLGSLESLICAIPFHYAAYLDVRSASHKMGGGWLAAPLFAGPLGYEAKLASWPLAVDGLIVMREMNPSTPLSLE